MKEYQEREAEFIKEYKDLATRLKVGYTPFVQISIHGTVVALKTIDLKDLEEKVSEPNNEGIATE